MPLEDINFDFSIRAKSTSSLQGKKIKSKNNSEVFVVVFAIFFKDKKINKYSGLVLPTKTYPMLIRQIQDHIKVNKTYGSRHKSELYRANFALKNLEKIDYKYYFCVDL